MGPEVADRRFDARFDPPAVPDLQVNVRPGCAVVLVDFSAGGALVQAPRPLRPGSKVQLHVTTASQRLVIPALLLRCAVWSLHPLNGVTYRGALKFDERVEWRWVDAVRRAPARQDAVVHVAAAGKR